jgi:CelD/BcsL family acetyltransferase involved in cellulose biosynthesis
MRLRLIDNWAEMRTRAQTWGALLDGSSPEDMFLTFEWCDALRQVHHTGGPAPTLVAEDGGRLVAVWPLHFSYRRTWRIIPCRVLADAGSWFMPHNGLACSGDRYHITRACLEYLLKRVSGWDVLDVDRLVEKGESHQVLERVCTDLGLVTEVRPGIVSPYVPIEGSWADYLATRSKNHRRNIKRWTEAVESLGKIQLQRYEAPGRWSEAFDAILAVDRQSWKQEEGSAITSRPWEAALYRKLLENASQANPVHLFILTLNGEPIAYDFGVVRARRYAALKTSFVDRLRASSPGIYMTMRVLQYLHEHDFIEYDFLGEAQHHKMHWTDLVRKHVALTIYRRKSHGRLIGGLRRLKGRRSANARASGAEVKVTSS